MEVCVRMCVAECCVDGGGGGLLPGGGGGLRQRSPFLLDIPLLHIFGGSDGEVRLARNVDGGGEPVSAVVDGGDGEAVHKWTAWTG